MRSSFRTILLLYHVLSIWNFLILTCTIYTTIYILAPRLLKINIVTSFCIPLLLSSNHWQLSSRFIFSVQTVLFLLSNIQPYAAIVFSPPVSFRPIQPHALLPDIDSLFRLSLVPLPTSGFHHITLLPFLLQISVSADVLSLHTASRCIFCQYLCQMVPSLRLLLLCPCFIRFAITLHTWFSIVPMFRYSSPSGGSGSSRSWD